MEQEIKHGLSARRRFVPDYSERKMKRELALYNEYMELMSVPGQSATCVNAHLMRKYDIGSTSTIYVIVRRVEARLGIEHKRRAGRSRKECAS